MAKKTQPAEGVLELIKGRAGFLRSPERNYRPVTGDVHVSAGWVERYRLAGGEYVVGVAGPPKRGPAPTLVEIHSINGLPPEEYAERRPFNELTVINPDVRLRFETPGGPLAMRVVDLLTPIGRGQRGLIVAPPRTGKTTLLRQMALGVLANHPELELLVLLVDERPEEVTEMRRTVRGEVVASSNDESVESHVRTARMVIERAKRLVEAGRHVFLLIDSLTRLGRAFNHYVGSSGRTLSGGLDARAMQEPKAMFGAARNTEDGGSLTIIASALIDTGSRMDELIFNEFKGTGNMEIVLSRELADRRIWPAIDLQKSGTRREELLLSGEELEQAARIRRTLDPRAPAEAMQSLLRALEKYPSNEAFISAIAAR